MNFKKLFYLSILVMKLKNEKWKIFKICFVFKSKNELYFRCTDLKWIRAQSVGQKAHSIFVLKWNSILIFFCFSFSLVNRKIKFKSQFWFLIKIEKWISVRFFRDFFRARALLWTIASPKLPSEKRICLSLFNFFKTRN